MNKSDLLLVLEIARYGLAMVGDEIADEFRLTTRFAESIWLQLLDALEMELADTEQEKSVSWKLVLMPLLA